MSLVENIVYRVTAVILLSWPLSWYIENKDFEKPTTTENSIYSEEQTKSAGPNKQALATLCGHYTFTQYAQPWNKMIKAHASTSGLSWIEAESSLAEAHSHVLGGYSEAVSKDSLGKGYEAYEDKKMREYCGYEKMR